MEELLFSMLSNMFSLSTTQSFKKSLFRLEIYVIETGWISKLAESFKDIFLAIVKKKVSLIGSLSYKGC